VVAGARVIAINEGNDQSQAVSDDTGGYQFCRCALTVPADG
jgi:hypothetical protein